MGAEGEVFLYVVTRGWRTGQPHEIEIWYVEYESCYYIVAEKRENAHWVQNIQHTPGVQVRLGKEGAWRVAQARPVYPETNAALVETVSRLMETKYNWSDGLIVGVCADL